MAEPQETTARTQAEHRVRTSATLIDAARELFAQHGYAAVGTDEIANKAGVTCDALHRHFEGGKEALFRAVLVQVSAETTQRVIAAATTTDDPWEELVLGTNAFLDACTRPEVQRIMLIDGPAVLGWDVWREADGNVALGLLETAITHAIDTGRMVRQAPGPLAHVLLGAIDEAAMAVARADDQDVAREEMSRMLRRLLEGLRGPTI